MTDWNWWIPFLKVYLVLTDLLQIFVNFLFFFFFVSFPPSLLNSLVVVLFNWSAGVQDFGLHFGSMWVDRCQAVTSSVLLLNHFSAECFFLSQWCLSFAGAVGFLGHTMNWFVQVFQCLHWSRADHCFSEHACLTIWVVEWKEQQVLADM